MKLKKRLLTAFMALTLIVSSSMLAFASDTTVQVVQASPVDAILDNLNKDWYGGVYYENDEIHIIPIEANRNNLKAQLKMSRSANLENTFIVDDANITRSGEKIYSINEMDIAKKQLLSSGSTVGIVGVGFDEKANGLAVFLDDYSNVTEQQKAQIVSMSNVKRVSFKDAKILGFSEETYSVEPKVTNEAEKNASLTLRGGNWLSRDDGLWSTLTTSAVYNWRGPDQMLGFLTCGHGWYEGQAVYVGGRQVGTVRIVRNANDTDFAFVESSYHTHGYMTDGNRITERRNPSAGMSVKAYRAKSGSENSTGKVENTNIDGEWGGQEFYDLFSTSIDTDHGDSGSAFIYNGNAIVGIMKGGLGGYSTSVGVKIMTIINDFDVQPSI